MALVNAKCTNCGGTLRVNDENETMICPYCRSAFAVEKAVSNYNFVYNTVINNDIKAGVVNIYGSEKSPEFTVESGILTAYSGEATELVIPDNVLEIGEGVFAGRRYLTRVQLPSRLRRIADAAFFGCENLESIDLPDTLESIGMLAFAHCRALRAVSLPARLRAVRWEAFHDCTGLEAVRYGGSLEDWCRLFYIGADRQSMWPSTRSCTPVTRGAAGGRCAITAKATSTTTCSPTRSSCTSGAGSSRAAWNCPTNGSLLWTRGNSTPTVSRRSAATGRSNGLRSAKNICAPCAPPATASCAGSAAYLLGGNASTAG